jgi:hypothetical protein
MLTVATNNRLLFTIDADESVGTDAVLECGTVIGLVQDSYVVRNPVEDRSQVFGADVTGSIIGAG